MKYALFASGLLVGLVLLFARGDNQVAVGEIKPAPKREAVFVPSARPVARTAPKTEPGAAERLQTAVDLGRKVLPSQADTQALQDYWSSAELIERAKGQLLDLSAEATTHEAQKERMTLVEYLESALNWEKNPQRGKVLEAIQTVLERDIPSLDAPVELKRSVAGDAIELFAVLYEHDEGKAQDLLGRASLEQQKLFHFGQNMVKHAREGQIRKAERT